MHNLTALSLGLPGTPLHGLNDFESPARPTSVRLRTGRRPRRVPIVGAWRRQPQATAAPADLAA